MAVVIAYHCVRNTIIEDYTPTVKSVTGR